MGQTWHAPAGAAATSAPNGPFFGAICRAKGFGTGLVMPWCDTDAMAAFSSRSVPPSPGAHAVLIVQAGWHLTPKLAIQHHRPGAADHDRPS